MKYEVSGKIVLVAGLGKSGQGAADLLRAQERAVRLSDAKPAEGVLPQTWKRSLVVDLIVLSPGVPTDIPEVIAAKQRGIPVIGEVELAGYWLRGPVIGITGSNGKTTTTAMTGHILGRPESPVRSAATSEPHRPRWSLTHETTSGMFWSSPASSSKPSTSFARISVSA